MLFGLFQPCSFGYFSGFLFSVVPQRVANSEPERAKTTRRPRPPPAMERPVLGGSYCWCCCRCCCLLFCAAVAAAAATAVVAAAAVAVACRSASEVVAGNQQTITHNKQRYSSRRAKLPAKHLTPLCPAFGVSFPLSDCIFGQKERWIKEIH